MKCPYCGYENNNKAKFCKNCGKNIEDVAQDASYVQNDSRRSRHSRENGGLKIALLGVCVVLIAAVGLLIFALVRRQDENLKADENGKALTEATEEAGTEMEPETEEQDEPETEEQTGDSAEAAASGQNDTSAASTASVAQPGETVQSTTESATEAAGQTTQGEASYFTPAGEEELPSMQEEIRTTPEVKSGDYVYEAASQYPEDFYFSNSDSVYLDESDLTGLTAYECDIARNEIYARHGYTFQTEKFANYFKQFAWYEEDPDYSDARLNEYEKKNASMILSYEKDKGWK